jgi:S1-C subfamily serine protease
MSTLSDLSVLSDGLAALAERAGHVAVSVVPESGRATSGVHWRPGLVVTADHVLKPDERFSVVTADGQSLPATLAGRDPGTDVAVLRIDAAGLPTAELGDAGALQVGNLVLALARTEEGGSRASLGIVQAVGPAWRSRWGGRIDRRILLDLRPSRGGEGGPLIDAAGRIVGFVTPGPRRRVLAIPAATVDRVLDQLASTGRLARGYLGLGMQPAQLTEGVTQGLSLAGDRGVLVVSVESGGPGDRAGILVGDVLLAIDGAPLGDIADVLTRLGPESVGRTLTLRLVRGSSAVDTAITVGERPTR